jgi:hypothetical protein
VEYIHNVVLFRHKEEKYHIVCRKIDGTGDHHVKQNKPDTEGQILYVFSHMQDLDF